MKHQILIHQARLSKSKTCLCEQFEFKQHQFHKRWVSLAVSQKPNGPEKKKLGLRLPPVLVDLINNEDHHFPLIHLHVCFLIGS